MKAISLYHQLNLPDYSEIILVKKAFRQLAFLYHPDRNKDPHANETFRKIVDAYEILGNETLKNTYDIRLKSGLNTIIPHPSISTETIRESKRKWYEKIRKEQAVLLEIEHLIAYENSLKTFPFHWRIALLVLVYASGILYIVSDWFEKGYKIFVGLIVFVFALIFLWNELYKYFWHNSLIKDESKYYRKSSSWFLGIFIVGVFATTGLIRLKKSWHLAHFPVYVYAIVHPSSSSLSFDYNSMDYTIDLFSLPSAYQHKKTVLIRISSKEPQIWEFAEN